jgi:beta-phosphoglucomutase-like phosphatase (HAD superfamily)
MPLRPGRRTIFSMSTHALSAPRPARKQRRRRSAVRTRPLPPPPRKRPGDLEPLAAGWQRSLDAGDRALRAAAESLSPAYLGPRRRALVDERRQTAELLAGVAREQGVRPLPWLSPVPIVPRMLGLNGSFEACLFDLDGVLTDSGLLHAEAWGKVLDDFLLRLSGRTGWQFIPFDRRSDYRTYIDGRSRLEGIHAFLESRGIRLPEGRSDDPPEAETAYGLANRKGETLARDLEHQGVTPLRGVLRYLEAAGRTGLRRAVISASASTLPMLEVAGLAPLFEARIDADVIRAEGARTPPAPDLLLAACRRLGTPPAAAVTFTHRPAGVAAGHAAGTSVIGVGEGSDEELLHGFGAERVVPSLEALLDPVLVADERRSA